MVTTLSTTFCIDMAYRHSRGAWLLSVDKLFTISPAVYFWTLTFREVYNDADCGSRWTALIERLSNWYRRAGGRMPGGLRMFEIHPGGHGLHVHVLWGGRVPIGQVRHYAEPLGFFWIQVRKCYSSDVGDYLAKYLGKDGPKLAKGVRRWSAFGGFDGVKCCDIEIDTPYRRDRLCLMNGRPKNPWSIERKLFELWLRSGGGHHFLAAGEALLNDGDERRANLYANIGFYSCPDSIQ